MMSTMITACCRSSSRRLIAACIRRHSATASSTTLLEDSKRCFSSAPAAETTLTLPPNLHIDAKSTCSPFYGLEPLTRSSVEEQDVREQDEDMDIDDDTNVEQALVYDASTAPEPLVVVPLPDRLKMSIYEKTDGEEVGTTWLSEHVFGHDEIRVDLITRTVQYQRNQARGKRKAKTKTIGEISGSGKKVRQQKGLGMARAGHSRPAHWRGGYKAHGPKGSIQDYANCKINKKVKRLALCHALSQKLKEQNVIIVNDLSLETHKTKDFSKLLQKWDIGGRRGTSAYIVDHYVDNDTASSWKGMPVNLSVASGNIFNIKVTNQLMVNVYDVLKYEKLVMTIAAVTALQERLEAGLGY